MASYHRHHLEASKTPHNRDNPSANWGFVRMKSFIHPVEVRPIILRAPGKILKKSRASSQRLQLLSKT